MPGKHGNEAILQKKIKFINNASAKYNNKYDYSKVNYINSRTAVIIICKDHGEFTQTPTAHLSPKTVTGCKSCAMRYTNKEFIEKAKMKHGDKFDYSESIYTRNEDMITIRCKEHGYFTQNANSHLQGNGCKECSIKTRGDSLRFTVEQFIEKAKMKHGDKFNYKKVIYLNNSTKVIIGCPIHGDYTQTPANHLTSDGCAKCSNLAISEKYKKYTYGQFIEETKKLNMDKYEYDLDISMDKKICVTDKFDILCKIHGIFNQQINYHLSGGGCPDCANSTRNDNNRYNTDDFIKLAIKKHGDLFDYSLTKYIDSSIKVIILCKKCNKSFSQAPTSHLMGTGCGFCNKGIRNQDEFIEKAKLIHGNNFDYTKTKYIRSTDKVIITCRLSGKDFKQSPSNHLKPDRGCPCCITKRQSKGQKQWLAYLSISKPNLQHGLNGNEYRIESTPYYADGYDLVNNTIYEFNGCYWHGCSRCFPPDEKNKNSGILYKDLKTKTLKKEQIIISKGYKYVDIWECDWYRACKAIKKLQYLYRLKKST
jgi:hypothetical protein